MAWEGPYYYRVRRSAGRVVRHYFGRGLEAVLAAQTDAERRAERERHRAALKAKKAELDDIERQTQAVDAQLSLSVEASLTAFGFRRHKRGPWRKRRGPSAPRA